MASSLASPHYFSSMISSTAMRCRSSYPLAAAALAAVSITRRTGTQAFSPLRTTRAHSCIRRQASTDVLASESATKARIRRQASTDVLASERSESATSALPDSHRVFVGNLSPDICRDEHLLRDSFGRFGAVVDITLHGFWKRSVDEEVAATQKKRSKVKPYAFVTFAEASSAAAALDEWGVEAEGFGSLPPISGCIVKSAVKRKPRPKSNKRKVRAEERQQLVEYLSREANVVLQCPKSHMQRLSDYLQHFDGVKVLSPIDPGRRAVTLLFVKAEDPAVFADRLLSVPYAAIAVNKMYILDGDVIHEGTLNEDVAEMALEKLSMFRRRLDQCDDSNDIVVRVQAFPPKIRSQLIAAMDSKWEEEQLVGVDISPTRFTHTLSVVQIETPKEYITSDASESGSITHLFGLAPALPTDAVTTHDRSRFHEDSSEEGGKDESVSRAYYKLQEALTRYSSEPSPLAFRRSLEGSVALDCGAAPGGWTKYLIDEIKCSAVFSIDPGSLDSAVENLGGVEHVKSTIENAIPVLVERGVKVDLWVSDMCLHNVADQVDSLLRAKEAGLLSRNTFFVLTLKCNIGHSQSSFEKQVEKEVARLKGIAGALQTLHLFSNRSGERTIMGRIS